MSRRLGVFLMLVGLFMLALALALEYLSVHYGEAAARHLPVMVDLLYPPPTPTPTPTPNPAGDVLPPRPWREPTPLPPWVPEPPPAGSETWLVLRLSETYYVRRGLTVQPRLVLFVGFWSLVIGGLLWARGRPTTPPPPQRVSLLGRLWRMVWPR